MEKKVSKRSRGQETGKRERKSREEMERGGGERGEKEDREIWKVESKI